MLKYSKSTQNAISAISYLAEHYDGGKSVVSSLEIAKARQLSKPLVAKLLTTLSQAGFLHGSPGPHGGYTLSKQPEQITLYDVACQFENPDNRVRCPFGPNWCGTENPCPLHDSFVALDEQLEGFLKNTNFSVFKTRE